MLTEIPGGPAGMPSFTNLTLARIWEVQFIGLFVVVLVLSYSQLPDLVRTSKLSFNCAHCTFLWMLFSIKLQPQSGTVFVSCNTKIWCIKSANSYCYYTVIIVRVKLPLE